MNNEQVQHILNTNKRIHEEGGDASILDLVNCDLAEIPSEVRGFTWVTELLLSPDGFYLPDEGYFGSYRFPRKGIANHISNLPDWLGELVQLKVLTCANDSRVQTGAEFDVSPLSKLINLECLDLSRTRIFNIDLILNLRNLKQLVLRYSEIENFDKTVHCHYLEAIDIGGVIKASDKLKNTHLFEKLTCPKILALCLNGTDFCDMEMLFNFSDLECLSILDCEISNFHSIANLKKLKYLSFGHPSILDYSALKKLNELERVTCDELTDIETLLSLNQIKKLEISDQGYFDANLEMANLPLLETFSCELIGLPNFDFLDACPNLSSLSFIECGPTNLDFLKGKRKLLDLNIPDSTISTIPALTSFFLFNVDISSTSVQDLSFLSENCIIRRLKLSNTSVCSLEELGKSSTLVELDISGTLVFDLAPIAHLDMLSSFDCSRSMVKDLTPILPALKAASSRYSEYELDDYFQFAGCPLVKPPIEIAEQGVGAILNYFDEIEQAEASGSTATISEVKCLILGKGGAGKTSLVRRLLDRKAEMPEPDEITRGIDIQSQRLLFEDGSPLTLNYWDFGGQEIYHATHQFFLTRRSVYIILDDTRDNEDSVDSRYFEYWLQLAELYGDGSPLLIVQNEKKDRSKELDLSGIRSRYPFFKAVIPVNVKTNRGLDELEKEIKFWAGQLPHIREKWPISWLRLKSKLEELRTELPDPVIGWDNFFNLCSGESIRYDKTTYMLSSYFHDLGLFLHFQKHNTLRDYIILKNDWITSAVYAIIDNESIKQRKGVFDEADMRALWSKPDHRKYQSQLISLMEVFELCYRIPNWIKPTWIIPQLFPPKAPNVVSELIIPNLYIQYVYRAIPKGLLARFIVRNHRFVSDLNEAWKFGAIFRKDDLCVYVKVDDIGKVISLSTYDNKSDYLFRSLCDDLEDIHSQISGISTLRKIACNCLACTNSSKPNLYELTRLEERKKQSKETIECSSEPYAHVQVNNLLQKYSFKIPESNFKAYSRQKLFISYARKDKKYKEDFCKHLETLNHKFEVWDDTSLMPGDIFYPEIQKAMLESQHYILLVTANFFSSKYIKENELPIMFKAQKVDSSKKIIPIIVKACNWQDHEISELNVLPIGGKSIDHKIWKNQDEAWAAVVNEIKKLP
jgi:internalin A